MRTILLCLGVLLLADQTFAAVPDRSNNVIAALERLDRVSADFGFHAAYSPAATEEVADIRAYRNLLSEHITADTKTSPAYVASLNYDTDALERANAVPHDQKPILRFVSTDLRAKRDNCAANVERCRNAAGEGLQVVVDVESGASPRNGYDVFYNYAWLDGMHAPIPFDSQSTPARKKEIPPGDYVFWAVKYNSKSHSGRIERYISGSDRFYLSVSP